MIAALIFCVALIAVGVVVIAWAGPGIVSDKRIIYGTWVFVIVMFLALLVGAAYSV